MTPRRAAGAAALLLAPRLAFAGSWFPPNAFSDNAAGTTSASFLKQSPGARAQALGGSFAAVSGDPDSVFWNPAGLARVSLPSFGLSYNALLETAASGSGYWVLKRGDGRTLGLGLLYQGQSPLQGYNSVGDPTGTFTAYDYCPTITAARRFDGVSAGLGLKLVHSTLAGQGATSVALDAGVQGRDVSQLGDGMIDVGAYIQNLGPPMTMGAQSDPLPFQAVAGLLWKAHPDFHVAVDGHAPADQSAFVSAGGEYAHSWGQTALALRAGYNFKTHRNLSGSAGLSAGFGLDFTQLRVDYAWVPYGDLGTTHRISLGWRY